MKSNPKRFYRNIYRASNGYRIMKDNENYGWYDDIRWALYDRDRFEQVKWDMDLFVELPEVPNPYLDMELPPFQHKYDYIQYLPEKWRVQKKIKGKICYFGTYDSFEEAEQRRNDLIKNRWLI